MVHIFNQNSLFNGVVDDQLPQHDWMTYLLIVNMQKMYEDDTHLKDSQDRHEIRIGFVPREVKRSL